MFYGYCDGGSQCNNKHAACAWIITNEDGESLYTNSMYIGGCSNNVAEYQALLALLLSALAGGVKELHVIQDSELVSRQVTGQYQVKAEHLKPLYLTVQDLINKFDKIEFESVRREHPMLKIVDKMCDQLIDSHK